jgi:hypothetical protein
MSFDEIIDNKHFLAGDLHQFNALLDINKAFAKVHDYATLFSGMVGEKAISAVNH